MKRRFEAQIRERLEDIWKALVPALPRRRRNPQHCAGPAPDAGRHRRARPPFPRENGSARGQIHHRKLEGLFPDDRQRRTMHVLQTGGVDGSLAALETQRFGQRRFTFQHENGALLNAPRPIGCGCSARSRYENVRIGVLLKSDRSKNLRP